MNFVNFETANHSWGPPEDIGGDKCGTLRVRKGVTNVEGILCMVSESCWKPSEGDLKTLNEGGTIKLRVFGSGHPMVSMGTEHLEIQEHPEVYVTG